jgi:RNA polymerase primary sigma factor
MYGDVSMTTQAQAEKEKAASQKKKSTSQGGRDETLSIYLSGLGGISLLDKEQERDLAASFRAAELSCWVTALQYQHSLRYISAHSMLETFSERKTIQELLRSLTRKVNTTPSRKRRSSIRDRKIEKIGEALRALDEDNRLLDDVISFLEQTEITPQSGESIEQRRNRTMRLEREHRAVRAKLTLQRRHAMRLRNRFVRSNLRLVVSVARRFHHYRLPLIDLIQEGNIGLIKSVHRFDHRKGFRFSTYAHWWIRQAIERAIMNKGTQIRLPVHIFDARREVAKAVHELAQKLRREPSLTELADMLGMTAERVAEILDAVPREPASIDERSGNDDDRSLAETLTDTEQPNPDESVIQVDQARHLRGVLETLTPMEVDIIQRRFGLIRNANETLEEIGKSYNLSRERVRQIQVQGLRKMYAQCRQRNIAI